jgi:hypothetical protein
MDLLEIRKTIITAVASDDMLVDRLVLKGGNALEIVHRIGNRASLDLDYSIEGDFDNPEVVGTRLLTALRDRFDAVAFEVFDYRFLPRPSTATPNEIWGGYTAEFKLISRKDAQSVKYDLNHMRLRSHVVGNTTQKRVFTVEISKHEYCRGKMLTSIDSFDCFVYTPVMIVVEKLRALCQQLPTYALRKNPAPRPRDFYDIHSVVMSANVIIGDGMELLQQMFAAKNVPVKSLLEIADQREFHRQGWPAVENSVRGRIDPFDTYFDFVVSEIGRLHPLWDP